MPSMLQTQPIIWPRAALASVLIGAAMAPAMALWTLASAAEPGDTRLASAPFLAIGVMAAGIIGAAAGGRLWIGLAFALASGAGLVALASALGLPGALDPLSFALAILIASVSFAARGALFARSALDKGWWIAVFVVAGEAAILITAAAAPGTLPDWLLALLPAQWTNMAIVSALAGSGALAASSALIALAGTAAATLLVAHLWPRRWPYIIMFSIWLALSALVYHYPPPPVVSAGASAALTRL